MSDLDRRTKGPLGRGPQRTAPRGPEGPQAGRRLAWVALGSNVGDRESWLRLARRELAATPGVAVAAASRVFETEPLGPPQRRYLNAVLALAVRLSARDLFARLQAIERAAGRHRDGPHYGPRTLDLDLLLYADERIREPDLEVPHPRLHERDFVLVPLAEVAAGARHPTLARTPAELLAARPQACGVRPVACRGWAVGPFSPPAAPCPERS